MTEFREDPKPYRIAPPATLSLEELVRRFDACMDPWRGMNEVGRPTSASIKRIWDELRVEIPESMVEFAQRSDCFGAWFAGLGEDYDNHLHVLQLNAQIHAASVENTVPMPPYLVMINHGHDEDYECLDLRQECHAGEYPIRYWSPGVASWSLAPSFPAYVEEFVRESK